MSTGKKMFLRKVLLHYYDMKKNTGSEENCESSNYLVKTFGGLARAKQICQGLIKRFKSGNFVFEDAEQADMLKKIEELEALEREKKRSIRPWEIKCRKKDVKREPYVPSPKKLFFQRILLHCFHMNEKSSESYYILLRCYGKQVPSDRTCYRMFKWFKSGNVDLEDEKYVQVGRPKKFKDEDLKTLLNENSSKTQEEIARILGVRQRVISYRLKKLGFIRKAGNWVPTSASVLTNKIKN